MTLNIVLQFVVVLAAIWMGARYSGVGLGLWGAVGLLLLVVGFGVSPTSAPIDVMLIILAVIMAASVMDAAGGIDFLVRVAERIIRANPKYVTIAAHDEVLVPEIGKRRTSCRRAPRHPGRCRRFGHAAHLPAPNFGIIPGWTTRHEEQR